MGEIKMRRESTLSRIEDLRTRLNQSNEITKGKACVYATGSFGRLEAGRSSDLDLFMVGRVEPIGNHGSTRSVLKILDEICAKADLVHTVRQLGIPDFDGDGKYLVHYKMDQFTKALGTPDDDASNTFTARLLMLLESRPLLQRDIYEEVIDNVIAAYWRDFEDHQNEFVPAYLTNDILRLWRTFCVNYEARTQSQPEEKKAKRKIKNYKLKYSRMLTCYSALLYLLVIYRRSKTVTPIAAREMTTLTPTQRLEWLLEQSDVKNAHEAVHDLIHQYDRFLQTTNIPEPDMIEQFKNKEQASSYMATASQFSEQMYHVIGKIGNNSRLHRLIVV